MPYPRGMVSPSIWSLALSVGISLVLSGSLDAQRLETWDLEVGGVARTAVVVVPASARRGEDRAQPSPLVFGFHGHGGRAQGYARRTALHEAWPEAVVLYPQGLPTPGMTDPEGRLPGWEKDARDQGGRDLAFFDALLARAREVAVVDESRIHVTGHSNGGGFTYLLLQERGDVLASIAPSASAAGRRMLGRGGVSNVPVLHAGAPDDPIVKWTWQEATFEMLRRMRGCDEGVAWDGDPRVQQFVAPRGGDVLLFEHGGGHRQHPDLARVAVEFFKAYPRRAAEDVGAKDRAPLALRIEEVTRVADSAPHQAFTDMVRFGPQLLLAFREGDGHVGGADGKVRLLASRDGKTWEPRALLAQDGVDLRDPKVSVTPGGELLVVMGGSRYFEGMLVGREPKVVRWSPDRPLRIRIEDATIDPAIAGPVDWLWRVTWVGDVGYGVVYQPEGDEWEQHLVRTEDGVRYEHVTTFGLEGRPSEATVRARPDGSLVALVRRDGGDRTARIGRADPPFTDWTWAELPLHLGGPELMVLEDGRMLAAGRIHGEGGPTTRIGEVTLDGTWRELCVLPSGGDTSYPALLVEGDRLLVSYYSSHEDRTAVYVAHLRLVR